MTSPTIYLLVLCFISAARAGTRCPLESNSPFCLCFRNSAGITSVNCEVSDDDLDSFADPFSDESMVVDIFVVTGSATKLPPTVFGRTLVISARISLRNLTEISEEAFVGQENTLHNLVISNSKLEKFPSELFSDLRRLYYLKFSGNKRVSSISMENVNDRELFKLDLSRNGLESIDIDTKNRFPYLDTIDLSRNNLDDDSGIRISDSSRVKSLDLSHNNLTEFPRDLLEDMPRRSSLNLSWNKISTLNETDVRTSMSHELTLSLYGNRIECGCDKEWIMKYHRRGRFNVLYRCSKPERTRRFTLKQLRKSFFSKCH